MEYWLSVARERRLTTVCVIAARLSSLTSTCLLNSWALETNFHSKATAKQYLLPNQKTQPLSKPGCYIVKCGPHSALWLHPFLSATVQSLILIVPDCLLISLQFGNASITCMQKQQKTMFQVFTQYSSMQGMLASCEWEIMSNVFWTVKLCYWLTRESNRIFLPYFVFWWTTISSCGEVCRV